MTIARTRRLLFARVVAAVSFVAVGTSCSSSADGGGPTKLPPPVAVAAAPTPTPTPTPEAEVEAAVRAYFAVADDAAKSGETTKLVSLSLSGCPCRALVQDIQTVYAQGRADTSGFDVRSVVVKEVQANSASVEVRYIVPAYRVLDRQGRITEEVPLYNGYDSVFLIKSGIDWLFSNTFDMLAGTAR